MTTSKKKKSAKATASSFFYASLGLAVLAKDQVEAVASALVKEGKLLAKDKGKFKKGLETKGQDLMTAVWKNLDVPSRKEFEALKRQVAGKRPTKK